MLFRLNVPHCTDDDDNVVGLRMHHHTTCKPAVDPSHEAVEDTSTLWLQPRPVKHQRNGGMRTNRRLVNARRQESRPRKAMAQHLALASPPRQTRPQPRPQRENQRRCRHSPERSKRPLRDSRPRLQRRLAGARSLQFPGIRGPGAGVRMWGRIVMKLRGLSGRKSRGNRGRERGRKRRNGKDDGVAVARDRACRSRLLLRIGSSSLDVDL